MNAVEAIKDRRSVRNYKAEKVDHETMTKIVELAGWSPSWANYQIARYTLIDDPSVIAKLGTDGVKGFSYNIKTLESAPGVLVLSYVKGKSGKLDVDADYATNKASVWEVFDAGIACQTFCLAAHALGVGTCIFGVIDDDAISEIAGLPEEETVAALVTYGYEAGDHAEPTPRKAVDEIIRFL